MSVATEIVQSTSKTARLLNAIQLVQARLNKGDQITIEAEEFRVALKGETPTAYVTAIENENQLELDL